MKKIAKNSVWLALTFILLLIMTACFNEPLPHEDSNPSVSDTAQAETKPTENETQPSQNDPLESNTSSSHDSEPHVHEWGELTVIEAATCGKEGYAKRLCSGCDEAEEQKIPVTGDHNFDENNACTVCGSEYTEIGLTFTYSEDLGGYGVTDYSGAGGIVEIPATYRGEAVTYIGESAFRNKDNMTGVVIPASIRSIGLYAFRASMNIKSVYITDLSAWCAVSFTDLYSNPLCFLGDLYVNGVKTADLVIPDGVEEITPFAFYHAVGIESISISADVEKIADNSFMYCTGVKRISVHKDNQFYQGTGNCLVETASGTLIFGCAGSVIPDDGSVKAIGTLAFYQTDIESVTIPASVKRIEDRAFYGCKKLSSLTLSEGLEQIGFGSFDDCVALKKVILPASVKKITGSSFSTIGYIEEFHITDLAAWCEMDFSSGMLFYQDEDMATVYYEGKPIKDLVIPDTVKKIENYAFYGWDDLETVTIPDHVKQIGEYAFSSVPKLTQVTVHGDGTVIDKSAFSYNQALTQVELNGVTFIGENAFARCKNLETLTFGQTLETIEKYAFDQCAKLQELHLPESVTSIANYAFSDCSGVVEMTLPANGCFSNLDRVFGGTSIPKTIHVVGDTVAENAFRSQNKIEKVTLADTVTSIGKEAFYACYALKEVTLGAGVETLGTNAFAYCSALQAIDFPETLTEIGENAFNGCTALKELVIPKSVTNIGKSAFQGCTSVTKLTFHDCPVSIGAYAFYQMTLLEEVDLGEQVKELGEHAFSYCSSLEALVIPESVKTIGRRAFFECNNLTTMTLPFVGPSREITADSCIGYIFGTTVTEGGGYQSCPLKKVTLTGSTPIPNKAFQQVYLLESVIIGDEISSIGDRAFYCCESLSSVSLGSGVTSIGSNAFAVCYLLESFDLKNVTEIGTGLFSSCIGLKKVTLSPSLTKIPESTFSNCTALSSIDIPENILTIEKSAFSNCDSLMNLVIGNGVLTIGEYAFYDCDELLSVTISDSVLKIEDYAFYYCEKLITVHMGKGLTHVGKNAFQSCLDIISVHITDLSAWAQIQFESYDANPAARADGLYLNGSRVTSIRLDQITHIGSYTFANCELTAISLGTSIQSIGTNAFYSADTVNGCTITYDGTTSQWNSITKGEYWDQYFNFTLICLGDTAS